jgi:minor extracellular serine protease Vpr
MKRIFTLLVLCSMSVIVFAQQATRPQLSPLTKRYLQDLNKAVKSDGIMPGYVYKKLANGNIYASALIKVTDAATAQSGLNSIGAYVGTKAGNIWTVQVPTTSVTTFTAISGISYIQLDEPAFPHLNVARKTTRVDSVQGGYNLPMCYSGKNVVVGVIDFGFDYNHPTFYDTLNANYRIKQVWEMEATGTPPSGYSYGKEITDTNLIKAEGTDNPAQFHGTCTTGMAAGSGYGGDVTNRKLRGMAYDADIVLVGVRRDSIGGQWMQGSFTDFIDGLNYIFNYAASVGKPAVINISWGSESGSHDGTSLFNQACDNLSGAGKIIVMSAGNEGQENLHLYKAFTPTDSVLNTFVSFTDSAYKRTWVDVWGDTGKSFCASVTLYKNGVAGATTGFVCTSDSVTNLNLLGANGIDTCYVQFISSAAEATNSKPRTIINLFNKSVDSVNITIKADEGYVNAWDEYYYYGYTYGYQSEFDSLGYSWATKGTNVSAISDMGSAQSVLLIGAYTSKTGWTDINGAQYGYTGFPVNQLTSFSSRGPMIDGRIKPDITAPGLSIATSVSSYDTAYTPNGTNGPLVDSKYVDPLTGKTYYYAEFDGTSAAAPAASGIVALMLQANPNLTPQMVKDVITETAITDNYTGVLPASGTNNWGHGKINAYGAVKKIVHDEGVYIFTGQKLDCTLYPNPNTGNFMLDYTGNIAEKLVVSVYDITGKLVLARNWQVNSGTNQTSFNMQHAAKGIYMVHVAGTNGTVEIKNVIR